MKKTKLLWISAALSVFILGLFSCQTGTDDPPPKKNDIIIQEAIGGTFTVQVGTNTEPVSENTTAAVRSKITLEAVADNGYTFDDFIVTAGETAVDVILDPVNPNRGQFIMPAAAVTVTASFNAIVNKLNFAINVNQPSAGGTFTVKVADANPVSETTTAKEGQTVTLAAAENDGYTFDHFSVIDESQTPIFPAVTAASPLVYTFVMPGKSVTVGADYINNNAASYAITQPDSITGGTIAVTINGVAVTEAKEGQTVILAATAAEGFSFGNFTLQDEEGNGINFAPVSGLEGTFSFVMPGKAVTVNVLFIDDTAERFAITPTQPEEGGSFTVKVGTVEGAVESPEGMTVTLTAEPANLYELDSFTVTGVSGESVTVTGSGNIWKFTMPAEAVTVSAEFDRSYAITKDVGANGTVTVKDTAKEGDVITVQVNPANGYKIESITAGTIELTATENSGEYRFTMPAADVTITVTFIAISAGLEINVNVEADFDGLGAIPVLSKSGDDEIVLSLSKHSGAKWYVDGALVSSEGTLTLKAEDYRKGEHSLSVMVTIGSHKYSTTVEFTVTE